MKKPYNTYLLMRLFYVFGQINEIHESNSLKFDHHYLFIDKITNTFVKLKGQCVSIVCLSEQSRLTSLHNYTSHIEYPIIFV